MSSTRATKRLKIAASSVTSPDFKGGVTTSIVKNIASNPDSDQYSSSDSEQENRLPLTEGVTVGDSDNSMAEEEETFTLVKRKRKKSLDGPWGKRTERRKSFSSSNSYGHLPMRADTSKTIIAPDGKAESLMLAVAFHGSPLKINSTEDAKEFSATVSSKLSTVKELTDTHVKIRELEFDEFGSPTRAFVSPTRTHVLTKVPENYGPQRLFSNLPLSATTVDTNTVKNLEAKHPFFDSLQFAAVKKNNFIIKEVLLHVTPAFLKKTHRHLKEANGRNQNKVMANKGVNPQLANATDYAKATGVFSADLNWEWTHFILYKLLGKLGQDEKNLGAATVHANTNMMFIEYQLEKILKEYPEGFDLAVRGYFIPATQLLEKIEYTITTPHREITFYFNAQQVYKPHFLNLFYTNAFVAALLELDNKKQARPHKTKPKRLNYNGAETGVPVFFKSSQKMTQLLAEPEEVDAEIAAEAAKSVKVFR